jgi:sterol desaturase/sphingolipid hydroxylase (fatty acid hydroxylase superfamily)
MTLFVPMAMALLPLHPVALFVFLAIMIIRNAMGHSGVEFHPIGWVDSPLDALTTVTHHDLHHQKLHGNYGLYFTWWDRWMGTELSGYKAAFRRAAIPAEAVTSKPKAKEGIEL